ncbi:MAG: RsmD family RNA methyltransferase [Leeuwenhoekiella sp.]
MRIISGSHRGRKIIAPSKLPVRPTTDRAKESLFNILRNHFIYSQITVLDLFAGTGNISYEFASRGTSKIIAVDEHGGCTHFIEETAKNLDMPIISRKADVYDYLKQNDDKYDIIFADPPYDFEVERFEHLVDLVFKNNLLTEKGMLVIEHGKNTDLSQHTTFFEIRNYGSSAFSFFNIKNENT